LDRELVGDIAAGPGCEVVSQFGKGEDLVRGVLMGNPVTEAAEAPLGKVLFVDGTAGKPACEDGLDFGLFVEPLEDGGGALAVEQAMVDLDANGLGDAGDFADAGDIRLGRRRLGWGPIRLWRRWVLSRCGSGGGGSGIGRLRGGRRSGRRSTD